MPLPHWSKAALAILLAHASRPLQELGPLAVDFDHLGRQLVNQHLQWPAQSTVRQPPISAGRNETALPKVALLDFGGSDFAPGNKATGTSAVAAAEQRPKISHATSKPGRGKKGAPEGGHHCSCLEGAELPLPHDVAGNVLLPASFFGLKGDIIYKRAADYGTYCGAHDEGSAPLCDVHNKSKELNAACKKSWCFVSVNCACGEAAKHANGKMTLTDAWHIQMSRIKTDYANPQEGKETNVWYSYMNCRESKAWIDEHIAKHNETFCGSSSSHCEQESEVCYRDAQGGRYAGSQAAAGTTNFHWISIGVGLGAFLVLVLIGWASERLRSTYSVT